MSLFPNRVSSGVRWTRSSSWRGMSRFHYLTDDEILEVLQTKCKHQRGFRSDTKTAFLVLRIPEGSPYRNFPAVDELRVKLGHVGVNPRHYQIDEDWYLYIFLKSDADTADLTKLLRYWCMAQGITPGSNSIEVYPAADPLPYPLQSGFTWLNERGQLLVRRDELSLEDAIAFFLDDAGKAAVDPDELLVALKQITAGQELVEETAEEQDFSIDPETPPSPTPARRLTLVEPAVLPVEHDSVELGSKDSKIEIRQEEESATEPVAPVLCLVKEEPQESLQEEHLSKLELSLEGTEPTQSQDQEHDAKGSRLVVFKPDDEATADNEMLTAIEDEEGTQLLLFPVPRQAVALSEADSDANPRG